MITESLPPIGNIQISATLPSLIKMQEVQMNRSHKQIPVDYGVIEPIQVLPQPIVVKNKKKSSSALVFTSSSQKIYQLSNFIRDLTVSDTAVRKQTFNLKTIDKTNMFDGVPFVQFNVFVRNDRYMQFIILRDLLKILADKCNNFKNLIIDKGKMRKILYLMVVSQRTKLNRKIEESCGMVNIISLCLLQEFRNNPESIGLKPSPIANHKITYIKVSEEDKTFDTNFQIYTDLLQFFRECMDAYMLMQRQNSSRQFTEQQCFELISNITRLRYNLSEVGEEIRIHDHSSDERIMRIQGLHPRESSERLLHKIMKGNDNLIPQEFKVEKTEQICIFSQQIIINQVAQTIDQIAQEKNKQRQLKLNFLLANKFNFSRNKYQTRESKLMLNNDKLEEDKALILESNKKQKYKSIGIADNRRRLAIERLKDPANDPEMKAAMVIAAQVLNINIDNEEL